MDIKRSIKEFEQFSSKEMVSLLNARIIGQDIRNTFPESIKDPEDEDGGDVEVLKQEHEYREIQQRNYLIGVHVGMALAADFIGRFQKGSL